MPMQFTDPSESPAALGPPFADAQREAGGASMTVPPFEPVHRSMPESSPPDSPVAAPRLMTLSVLGGLANLHLWTDRSLIEPFAARFEGPQPEVSQVGDDITIRYPQGPFTWARTAADIRLRPDLAWSVHVRGGLSHSDLDLTDTTLRSFELTGGASRLEMRLGAPDGTVPVRIRGGISRATVERPGTVPVRLEIGGGASRLVLDAQEIGAVGGHTCLESGAYRSADHRYWVQVGGGASRLTVTS